MGFYPVFYPFCKLGYARERGKLLKINKKTQKYWPSGSLFNYTAFDCHYYIFFKTEKKSTMEMI